MNTQNSPPPMMEAGPPRRLPLGSRLAARITGVSQDALRGAPDDEDRVVRLVAMVMTLVMALAICGWTVALAIARGRLDWAVLPFGLLPGLILYAIDRAMGRWIWTQSGRRIAEARGFRAGGGPVIWARLLHLALRLLVSGVLSLTLAQFLGLALFEPDTHAELLRENQALNRPVVQDATQRVDAMIKARKDEIDLMDKQAGDLLAVAEQAVAVGQKASSAQIDDLTQERAALVDRTAKLDAVLDCQTQDISAERYGQTRCDGTATKAGEGNKHNYAKDRAAAALNERTAAQTRVQAIDDTLAKLRLPADGHALDTTTQDQLSRLATRRAQAMQELEKLAADRTATIQAELEADPGFVPQATGLIQSGAALERLKAQSDWMWWSVHLVLASLLVLDLGVVIVLTLVPPPRFVVLFEVLDAETRMQRALARAETSIAAAMEQRMQAQAQWAKAETRAADQVIDLRSRASMHQGVSELMDELMRDELRKAG